tara:strand:- start:6475 stop:6912 length:438 start_codon:yes stop_codon:yes gene_type:complete
MVKPYITLKIVYNDDNLENIMTLMEGLYCNGTDIDIVYIFVKDNINKLNFEKNFIEFTKQNTLFIHNTVVYVVEDNDYLIEDLVTDHINKKDDSNIDLSTEKMDVTYDFESILNEDKEFTMCKLFSKENWHLSESEKDIDAVTQY